jgi:hypothetical protein
MSLPKVVLHTERNIRKSSTVVDRDREKGCADTVGLGEILDDP